MKHVGDEWIMHGLFVDDMIHAATSDELRDQFITEISSSVPGGLRHHAGGCDVIVLGNGD